MNKNWTTYILWIVYIGLLLVLLPHTAWLFNQFEPANGTITIFGLSFLSVNIGGFTAWAGAFAFEAAIAVLTHKLAKHFEAQPKRLPAAPRIYYWSGRFWELTWWSQFRYRYMNAYSFGLLVAVGVSALANLAHSVEFGRPLAIFAAWGIEAKIYQFAFGGVLPVVSLLFARVLSNVSESEDVPNPELDEAKKAFAEFRRATKENENQLRLLIAEWQDKTKLAEQRAKEAEHFAHDAETRFAAAGELFARLFAEEKRQRILAARQMWPELPLSSVAIIAQTSPGYVSDVLNNTQELSAGMASSNGSQH